MDQFAGVIKRKSYWYLDCICGNVVLAETSDLNAGKYVSCGCQRLKNPLYGTPTYYAWQSAKKKFGVPDEWEHFDNFLADVGLKPSPEHELTKRDYRKPHSKENTYWKHRKEEYERFEQDEHLINPTLDMRAVTLTTASTFQRALTA